MEKDLIDSLLLKKKRLSKGQKALLAYLKENYDKAAFMTAARLGTTVGVSESTVVRFATDMGYDGYPELKKALQTAVRRKLTSVQRIEASKELWSDDEDIFKYVINADSDRIRRLSADFNSESFGRAVDLICSAHRIYISGMRTSSALSSYLGSYLNLLRPDVTVIRSSANGEIYEQMLHLSNEDLLIDISFPRYSNDAIKVINYAKQLGAAAIAITDGESSPLAAKADVSLFAKSDMVSFVDSLVAPMCLINAIVLAVASRYNDASLDTAFENLEQIWNKYSAYDTTID